MAFIELAACLMCSRGMRQIFIFSLNIEAVVLYVQVGELGVGRVGYHKRFSTHHPSSQGWAPEGSILFVLFVRCAVLILGFFSSSIHVYILYTTMTTLAAWCGVHM